MHDASKRRKEGTTGSEREKKKKRKRERERSETSCENGRRSVPSDDLSARSFIHPSIHPSKEASLFETALVRLIDIIDID